MIVSPSGSVLSNEHGAFSLDERAATKGQDPGHQTVTSIQAGDLREEALWASRHSPGGNVVSGAMPRTDQATLPVDRAIGEISTEMPTTPCHREELAIRVSYGVPSGTADNPRHELDDGRHLGLSCHCPSP